MVDSPMYGGFMEMCEAMVEKRHVKLEKSDCPEVRGEIKALRYMLKLQAAMDRAKRPAEVY